MRRFPWLLIIWGFIFSLWGFELGGWGWCIQVAALMSVGFGIAQLRPRCAQFNRAIYIAVAAALLKVTSGFLGDVSIFQCLGYIIAALKVLLVWEFLGGVGQSADAWAKPELRKLARHCRVVTTLGFTLWFAGNWALLILVQDSPNLGLLQIVLGFGAVVSTVYLVTVILTIPLNADESSKENSPTENEDA